MCPLLGIDSMVLPSLQVLEYHVWPIEGGHLPAHHLKDSGFKTAGTADSFPQGLALPQSSWARRPGFRPKVDGFAPKSQLVNLRLVS